MLSTVADILARRIAGHRLSAEELEAALPKRDRLPQPATGGVAVIPVHGVIVPRASLFSDISGATSLERLTADLRQALGDEEVDTIVLDVDSPGGSAAGATEFAREVMKARTKKPIVAVAQYTMASAAYWIASAATEIVASPSAYVGSIGVYTMHDDLSKALEEFGVKRTYIAAGRYKVEGNETEPLSKETRAYLQDLVDNTMDRFVTDISRGRGVAKDVVKNQYGEGRVLNADAALSAGMIDKIATLEETVNRLTESSKGSTTKRAMRSEEQTAPIAASDTPQELPAATGQDRARPVDVAFELEFDRAMVALGSGS